MKKVLVYDVAAESGGALSILNDFYQYVLHSVRDVEWYFVVSVAELKSEGSVSVRRYPKVKKSWLQRIVFDIAGIKKVIKEVDPDIIFSLQNIMIPGEKRKQIVYLHQSVPFCDVKMRWIESKTLWVYQNILSKVIYWSVKRAEHIIVQTKWMKEAVVRRTGVVAEKISVISPGVAEIGVDVSYDREKARTLFVYPATAVGYKNHALIVEAVELLKEEKIGDFKVLFTVKRAELETIGVKYADDFIECVGTLERKELMKILREATLLFPSKVETLGLPLMESKLCKAFILAGDRPFSREIIGDYPNALFFAVDSPKELAKHMRAIITKEKEYVNVDTVKFDIEREGWGEVVKELKKI